MQPIAVTMKRQPETAWLADLPAHAVLDTAARMDAALRRMVKERKAGRECGFPRVKKKFVNESGIYCVGQATEIADREAHVPKIGAIRLRGGDIPEGRLLSARIWRDGNRWMISAQFECNRPEPLPPSDVTIGVDLGVATLITAFDGSTFEEIAAPKHLRKAQKRLRRAQRALSRRRKGSARRRTQARRVGAIHRKVRERRKDLLHQISHRLTAKAGVLKFETLNVKGMGRNRHLALSVADAGMSRLVTLCTTRRIGEGERSSRSIAGFPAVRLVASVVGSIGRCASSRCKRWSASAATSWDVTATRLSTISGIPRNGEPGQRCPSARGDWRSGACSGAGR